MRNLFKRLLALVTEQPAAVAAAVQAIAALVVTRYHVTPGQTGAIEAAVSAVLGLLVALGTHPFRTQAVSGLIAAVGTLAVAFGWHFSASTVSIVNAVAVALLLLVRGQDTVTLAEYRAQLMKRSSG